MNDASDRFSVLGADGFHHAREMKLQKLVVVGGRHVDAAGGVEGGDIVAVGLGKRQWYGAGGRGRVRLGVVDGCVGCFGRWTPAGGCDA
jgi:hypothetical protein